VSFLSTSSDPAVVADPDPDPDPDPNPAASFLISVDPDFLILSSSCWTGGVIELEDWSGDGCFGDGCGEMSCGGERVAGFFSLEVAVPGGLGDFVEGTVIGAGVTYLVIQLEKLNVAFSYFLRNGCS